MATKIKSMRIDADVVVRFEKWCADRNLVQQGVLEDLLLMVMGLSATECLRIFRQAKEWREAGRPPISPTGPDAGEAEADAAKQKVLDKARGQQVPPSRKQHPGVG